METTAKNNPQQYVLITRSSDPANEKQRPQTSTSKAGSSRQSSKNNPRSNDIDFAHMGSQFDDNKAQSRDAVIHVDGKRSQSNDPWSPYNRRDT